MHRRALSRNANRASAVSLLSLSVAFSSVKHGRVHVLHASDLSLKLRYNSTLLSVITICGELRRSRTIEEDEFESQ